MKEAAEILIRDVVSLTGLPISLGLPGHGSSDDYELGWSGRRTEDMIENFFAQVHICGNELVMGFWIEVRAYGYDLITRDGFSKPYWGRTITSNELTNNRELLIEEIKGVIMKAWNDLPQLYQKMLQQDIEQKRFLEQLRQEGKFVE